MTMEEYRALALGRITAALRGGLMSVEEIHRRLDEAGFPVPDMDDHGWCWDPARDVWWIFTVIGEVSMTTDTGAAAGRGPCLRARWLDRFGYGDTPEEAIADLCMQLRPHLVREAAVVSALRAPVGIRGNES